MEDKKVGIAFDNLAVVQVLNIGRTRDLTLAAIARNIQYQVAVSNIELKVTHIQGKKMSLLICGRPLLIHKLH